MLLPVRDSRRSYVSSSRAVLYASNGEDFAEAAAAAVRDLREQINRHR